MAKEYIERRDALEIIHGIEAVSSSSVEAIMKLNTIPAADVVEVVRCKDCKHATLSSMWPPYCDKHKRAVKEDGFCSDGERRDSDGR